MKGKMKKLVAFALATIMVLAMSITVSAETVNMGDGGASIEIKNAAKGETYRVYKIFDAERSQDGKIAFKLMSDKTAAPAGFTAATNGYITTAPSTLSPTDIDVLRQYVGITWTENTAEDGTKSRDYTYPDTDIKADGEGDTLKFTGLEYGYYLVASSIGAVVSIDDTNATATVVDKNSTVPALPEDAKKVKDEDVYIGQKVEYTLKFNTTNYYFPEGAAEPKQIAKYVITDTLPDFLKDVKVTSITVIGATEQPAVQQFDEKGQIIIDWVNADKTSKYDNGAILEIKYEATVTDKISLTPAENSNKVTLSWEYADGSKDGGGEGYESTETISTYAIVIQKVDENDYNLEGAKFVIKGYEVTGSDGEYKITGIKMNENDEPLESIEMDCDEDGKLVIIGLAQNNDGTETPIEYEIRETQAPTGYNLKVDSTKVKAQKTSTTTTKEYYDEDGNKVETETTLVKTPASEVSFSIVNERGAVLPSTGGIGTTIFYVVGGVLVVAAGILLITKKRMSGRD